MREADSICGMLNEHFVELMDSARRQAPGAWKETTHSSIMKQLHGTVPCITKKVKCIFVAMWFI